MPRTKLNAKKKSEKRKSSKKPKMPGKLKRKKIRILIE